jgi:16S rRNA (cytosine967-C5)-methyltransferase
LTKSALRAQGQAAGVVTPARRAAFEILRQVEEGGYASVLLASHEEQLEPRDRALCHELVMGVLRFQLWLDRAIEYFAARSVERLDLAVKLALRLGLYQLRFLTRIPHSAAVNESVNLVRRARLRSAESFVNAVLRRATRELEYDPVAAVEDQLERLAIASSHPRWLIERWVNAFGYQEAEALARANNLAAPVVFRVVRAEETEDVLQRLRDAGATLKTSAIASNAWRIQGGGELAQELSHAGRIYFQDEASQLMAQIVGAEPGDQVLDVCAAPGSKASQIAAQGHVAVIAGDIHLHRLKIVRQTVGLQALSNVKTVMMDARSGLPFPEGTFERVLVDAPCSGTGTLRHNPEIRWRISAEDIVELSNRQHEILTNAAVVVKQGGRLVYSTCSVEPEENEAVVQAFTSRFENFEPTTLSVAEVLRTSVNSARTWPHRDNTDGFFVAAFTRKR